MELQFVIVCHVLVLVTGYRQSQLVEVTKRSGCVAHSYLPLIGVYYTYISLQASYTLSFLLFLLDIINLIVFDPL